MVSRLPACLEIALCCTTDAIDIGLIDLHHLKLLILGRLGAIRASILLANFVLRVSFQGFKALDGHIHPSDLVVLFN